MDERLKVPNVGIRVKKRGSKLTGVVIRHTPGGWMEINWDVGKEGPRLCDYRELEILYDSQDGEDNYE